MTRRSDSAAAVTDGQDEPGVRYAAKIKVDRSWVGAPDSALLGNPTVWLFIGASATLALTATYHLRGALPMAPTVALNTIAFYVMFTVMRDSVHRTAHRSRFVNATLGRLSRNPP